MSNRKRNIRIILVVVLVGLGIAGYKIYSILNNDHVKTQDVEVDAYIKVEDFAKNYMADTANSNATYLRIAEDKKKIIGMEGVLENIEHGDQCNLFFKTQLVDVQVALQPDQNEAAKGLKKGDTVKFKAYINALSIEPDFGENSLKANRGVIVVDKK